MRPTLPQGRRHAGLCVISIVIATRVIDEEASPPLPPNTPAMCGAFRLRSRVPSRRLHLWRRVLRTMPGARLFIGLITIVNTGARYQSLTERG